MCRAPHGACELKYHRLRLMLWALSHAPHGACELKYNTRKEDLR